MSIALRDYQLEAINAVTVSFREGINRQLISLPTGSGKTVIMSALAMQFNKKTILLAHREELIEQAVAKFKLIWPEVSIGVCMADRDEIDSQVVVGSIQSCSRPKRLARLKELGFELMMIDEAHHSKSDSYQIVINELGFVKGAQKLLLGVTATPHRGDNQSLGDIFDKITFSRSISTMIKAGYLSPIVARKILTNFTLEKIRTCNGDFSIPDLAEAVNTPERNAFIVSKFQEYAPNRKGIVFCCDVQHCQDLADAFKSLGVESCAVWGDMGQDERKITLEAFKNGHIQVVTSCGILTEGYDEPSVNAIIMARPTKSSVLYTQCIGRGLRLCPSKQDCLVIDFSDKHHVLDGIMSLSSAMPELVAIEEKTKIENEEIDKRPKVEILEECDREFDILGAARFIWVQVNDEWSLLDDEKNEIIVRSFNGGFIASLYYQNGLSRQIVSSPLSLEYCSGVCEDYARRHLKTKFADISKPWLQEDTLPTQSQKEYLEKNGAYREGMRRGEASIEIKKIIVLKNKQRRALESEPVTSKQKYMLMSHGIDPTNMSKFQAMQAISKLKQANV